MINLDHKQLWRAVHARRERTKRTNDYKDNRLLQVGEDGIIREMPYKGEYRKQIALRKKYQSRLWICLWIMVGILIVIGLAH